MSRRCSSSRRARSDAASCSRSGTPPTDGTTRRRAASSSGVTRCSRARTSGSSAITTSPMRSPPRSRCGKPVCRSPPSERDCARFAPWRIGSSGISAARCRSSVGRPSRTWCSAPAGRRDRATPSCCLPRARATTCSRITRNGGRRSGRSWRPCEQTRYTNVGPSPMVRDTRWETRLLALVAAILVVFGLTAVYSASSLLTISGGQVGSSFALKQALGAAVGGIVAAFLARSDYRKWQRAAWPVLGVVAVLLLLPLLPFTERIAPNINGARRGVNLGCVRVQPCGLAKFAVVVWTAMLAAKKGERIRTFQYGLLPFIVVLAPLVALIFFEPNLSMALLVTLLAGVVLFTAVARLGHFITIAVVATPILFGAVASAQYRRRGRDGLARWRARNTVSPASSRS